jgi:hypothetical protein
MSLVVVARCAWSFVALTWLHLEVVEVQFCLHLLHSLVTIPLIVLLVLPLVAFVRLLPELDLARRTRQRVLLAVR